MKDGRPRRVEVRKVDGDALGVVTAASPSVTADGSGRPPASPNGYRGLTFAAR